MPPIENLSSARTTVREVQADDLPDLLAVNGDPEVTRFLPYATWQGLGDAQAWLERMNTLAGGGSARQLVIARNADARVIGTALLFRFEEASRRVELGYVLGRAHWKQGYAGEALRLLLGHAFGALGIRRVEAEIDPGNTASNALVQALGFTREGCLRERWLVRGEAHSVNVWGLLDREWPTAHEGAAA